MEIKELTPADAGSYRELRLFSVEESPTAFGSTPAEAASRSREFFAERLADELNHTFGAINEEGELVGMILLRQEQREKTRHKAFIYGVYVRPEYRGKGIGQALMEAALARAGELDIRQVNLGVNVIGEAAIALYESCGFRRFGVEKDAYKVGDRFYDVAYMVCRLPREAGD